MTMKQLHQSLEMMRNACIPKTNAPIGTKTLTLFMEIKKKNGEENLKKILWHFAELVEGLHKGEWPEIKEIKVSIFNDKSINQSQLL